MTRDRDLQVMTVTECLRQLQHHQRVVGLVNGIEILVDRSHVRRVRGGTVNVKAEWEQAEALVCYRVEIGRIAKIEIRDRCRR
jgi:hypothetical protein